MRKTKNISKNSNLETVKKSGDIGSVIGKSQSSDGLRNKSELKQHDDKQLKESSNVSIVLFYINFLNCRKCSFCDISNYLLFLKPQNLIVSIDSFEV